MIRYLLSIWLTLFSSAVEYLHYHADYLCIAELPAIAYVGWEREYDKCVEAFGFEPWKAPVE